MVASVLEDVRRAARVLLQPNQVVEVRVPKAGRFKTISGYFEDFEKLAQAVGALEEARRHPGIYWTLNPVARSLLARADHKVKSYADCTTADTDILCRRRLPLDFDPKRPAGISSNDVEHAAALALADRVCAELLEEGWPDAIKADSGNGAHLVYQVDLPNDAASDELLKRLLQSLAARFDNDQVSVDKTTFNASRIFKIYGTTARKGDHTAERPHRLSRLLHVPDLLTTVPLELLQALAAKAPASAKPAARRWNNAPRSGPAEFDVRQFLDRHGVRYRAPVAFEGGWKYVLEECPFDASHKAPDSAVFDRPDGLGFKCFHNSCDGRDWKEFREHFEGPREPFVVSERRAMDAVMGGGLQRAGDNESPCENVPAVGNEQFSNHHAVEVEDNGDGWRESLIRAKSAKGQGPPLALLANAMIAFRMAPEWRDVLSFNEFSLLTVTKKKPIFGGLAGSEWTDHQDRLAADWLQHNGIFVSVEVAGQAVQAVARDSPFHPVRDYLNGLFWDGTHRASGWINLYLGVEPSEYSRAVGERWLRSAVARIMQPGCKVDCCLILEGEQGIRKSTALRRLSEPYFTDELADLGSKDAALQTRGVWVIEIAELDAMTRSETSKVKAFMSRPVDRFRPPYGRHLLESPRQCVFAGSVNHGTYLRDETGGRRFWPVSCTRILCEELARDRDQLWAEAMAAWRAGLPWWLDTAELNRAAEDEQSQRYEEGSWDELIMDWAAGQLSAGETSISVPEVLERCLKKPAREWTRADEMRVARSLKASRWVRFRQRGAPGETSKWRYRPPVPI